MGAATPQAAVKMMFTGGVGKRRSQSQSTAHRKPTHERARFSYQEVRLWCCCVGVAMGKDERKEREKEMGKETMVRDEREGNRTEKANEWGGEREGNCGR